MYVSICICVCTYRTYECSTEFHEAVLCHYGEEEDAYEDWIAHQTLEHIHVALNAPNERGVVRGGWWVVIGEG